MKNNFILTVTTAVIIVMCYSILAFAQFELDLVKWSNGYRLTLGVSVFLLAAGAFTTVFKIKK